MRFVLFHLGLALVSFSIAACGESGTEVVSPDDSSLTPSPAPAPQIVGFPYSWTDQEVEVAIVGVTNLGLKTDDFGKTTQVIAVALTFRNLAHEQRLTEGTVGPLLALKTERGNIYRDESVGFLFHISDFGPEEVKDSEARFSVMPDERPIELWRYEPTGPLGDTVSQQTITHIWKLE